MNNRWHDISYLRDGTEEQKEAYNVLVSLDLFVKLSAFHPLLVGTYPLNINIEESDLDIVCEVHDFDAFEQNVHSLYHAKVNYVTYCSKNHDILAIIISFVHNSFIIELFGQPLPIHEQYGYRHMVIEDWLLNYGGESVRKEIIALKKNRFKTEPAFAKCFNLPGDPYEVLFAMSGWTDNERIEYLEIMRKSNEKQEGHRIIACTGA